jgi:hypothetical protein
MAEKKITKRDRFNTIINWAEEKGDEDMRAFAEHEIELLDNKKSGTKSETKAQKINKVLDERIMAVLENAEEPLTASGVMSLVDISGIEGLDSLTLPKVTNRLTALGKVGGRVDRIKDKRSVLFSVGTGEGFNKE